MQLRLALPKLIIGFITFWCLIFLAQPLLAAPAPIDQMSDNPRDWRIECERRNIIYGCECDCRETVGAPADDTFRVNLCIPRENLGDFQSCTDPTKKVILEINENNQTFNLDNGRYPGSADRSTAEIPTPSDWEELGANITSESNRFYFFSINGGDLIETQNGSILIGATIANTLNFIFIVIIAISLGMAFYGGFLYVTANDDEEQLEQAKNTLRNAVIGLAIALAGGLIVGFASEALGFRADADFDTIIDQEGDRNIDNVPDLEDDPNIEDFIQ